jgi:hypothetical protein
MSINLGGSIRAPSSVESAAAVTTNGRAQGNGMPIEGAPITKVPELEFPASMRNIRQASWVRESLDDAVRRKRVVISPAAVATIGTPAAGEKYALLEEISRPDTVFMMGDNPDPPRMPERPTLGDFFRLRLEAGTAVHMLQSAKQALEHGLGERVVMACLLHDIAVAGLIFSSHGHWGAQMVGPYVDEEVAWAIEKHEALRYFADESVGYSYPEAYIAFFGPDYSPPEYIYREHQEARKHRWYMTSRLITRHSGHDRRTSRRPHRMTALQPIAGIEIRDRPTPCTTAPADAEQDA